MSKKWPVHKVFRTPQHNDLHAQRSPSPIVEMPLSPDPETANSTNNGSNVGPRFPSSVERSLSPRRSQSPFSSSLNKGVREIPIEVEHEVKKIMKYSELVCANNSVGIFWQTNSLSFSFRPFLFARFCRAHKNWRLPFALKLLFYTHTQSTMLDVFSHSYIFIFILIFLRCMGLSVQTAKSFNFY